ncbi:MAG: tetratricopeptide repeat protein [Sphingobacteriales bacterium]|nr:tetratricopeptide repeat protein [Sphingobacteriales bacterium]
MNHVTPRLQQLLSLQAAAPNDAFIAYAIAAEYSKSGDTAAAIVAFETLRRQHPAYVGLYYHLGKLYQQQENYEQARFIFEAGMQTAQSIGDSHALRELQAAYRNLLDEMME